MVARPIWKQERNRRNLERPTTGWLTHFRGRQSDRGTDLDLALALEGRPGKNRFRAPSTLTFHAAGRLLPTRSVGNIASPPTRVSSPLRSCGSRRPNDRSDRP
jgi:hypothetical protein